MPLVVVPTPIGNLEDITLRALRTLREADLIACEDTRRTGRLLAHYEIKKPLLAYHEHNEDRLAPELAEKARTEKITLVSDAGTPLVSDPGYRLVRTCIEAGVEVEVLPGPSAVITALVSSGLPVDTVVFLGFLPRKGRERTVLLDRIGRETSTFVIYESPHRLTKTLTELPAPLQRTNLEFLLLEVSNPSVPSIAKVSFAKAIAGRARSIANVIKRSMSLPLVVVVRIFVSPFVAIFPTDLLSIPSHFSLEAQFLLCN